MTFFCGADEFDIKSMYKYLVDNNKKLLPPFYIELKASKGRGYDRSIQIQYDPSNLLTSRIGEEVLPPKEVHLVDSKRKRVNVVNWAASIDAPPNYDVLKKDRFKKKYIKSMLVNDDRIKVPLDAIIDFINSSCKDNNKDRVKRNGIYNEITLRIAKECRIEIQEKNDEIDLDKVIVDSLRNYCKDITKGSRGPRPKFIEQYLKVIVGGIISRASPTLTQLRHNLEIGQ